MSGLLTPVRRERLKMHPVDIQEILHWLCRVSAALRLLAGHQGAAAAGNMCLASGSIWALKRSICTQLRFAYPVQQASKLRLLRACSCTQLLR